MLEVVLELPSFWRIAEVKVTDRPPEELAQDLALSRVRGRVDVRLEVQPGDLPCPACRKSAKVDDVRQDRVWERLPMFDDRVFLHARTPRVNCPEHGVVSVATPWASPKSGFTYDAEFRMLDLAKEMPVVQVAMKLHIGRHRVERVVSRWVGIWRRRIRVDQVTAIAIDEKAVHKGHRYVSVVSDQDTHDVLFATQGRGAQVLEEFARELRVHGGDPVRIAFITMDMNAGYEKGAAEQFPNAEIVFDEYHVVSRMQRAVDEVRREEQRTSPGLQKSRGLLLRNPSDLTHSQQARLAQILLRYRTVRARVQPAGAAGDPRCRTRGRDHRPTAMVLAGHAQPSSPSHRRGVHDQAPLAGRRASHPDPAQQCDRRGARQRDPARQTTCAWLLPRSTLHQRHLPRQFAA